jgi:hypothetical protein
MRALSLYKISTSLIFCNTLSISMLINADHTPAKGLNLHTHYTVHKQFSLPCADTRRRARRLELSINPHHCPRKRIQNPRLGMMKPIQVSIFPLKYCSLVFIRLSHKDNDLGSPLNLRKVIFRHHPRESKACVVYLR